MYEDVKNEIVEASRYIDEKGWNHGRAGNISVFIRDNQHVVITPSGVVKAKLRPEDILVVDIEGNVVEGFGKPSIELPMHLAIYRAYDYVNAVIHAHGIYSTILAVTKEPLPPLIDEAIVLLGGEVRVAEYAFSGTEELADNVVKALRERKAAIIANHGAIAVGKDLNEAIEIVGLVERLSEVYVLARLFGKVHLLPEEVVEFGKKVFLRELRKK